MRCSWVGRFLFVANQAHVSRITSKQTSPLQPHVVAYKVGQESLPNHVFANTRGKVFAAKSMLATAYFRVFRLRNLV